MTVVPFPRPGQSAAAPGATAARDAFCRACRAFLSDVFPSAYAIPFWFAARGVRVCDRTAARWWAGEHVPGGQHLAMLIAAHPAAAERHLLAPLRGERRAA